MYQRTTWSVLLIALPIVLAACSDNGDSSEAVVQRRSADEAAIRALLASNEAACNRRDSAGVAATFVRDGDIWIVGRPKISGLDAIRRNEEEFYRTPGFQAWHTSIDGIRFITPDVALVESTDTTVLDTGEFGAQSSWIAKRQGDEWRIAAVRIMSIENPP